MPQLFPSPIYVAALALVLAVLRTSSSSAAFIDGWEDGYTVPAQATWAAYYREHVRVRLGPEQRLPNGISWRLHEDVGTKLAFPRIIWMPNAQSMRRANSMLDTVQGGAMLFSAAAGQELDRLNDFARSSGFPPLEYDRPVVQTDVGLAYATPTLVSLVDLGFVQHEGTGVPRIIRGITFDLRTRQMFRVKACPGSDIAYGGVQYTVRKYPILDGPINYLFQFGELLRVCDRETYLKFIQLLTARANLVADQMARSKDPFVRECNEKAGPFIGEDQEIVLYLTFRGLAVHNTEYWPNSSRSYCTLGRSPVNPVVLPYRELEPFMIPGPWRDELLKLN
jgi:hypothetical protein